MLTVSVNLVNFTPSLCAQANPRFDPWDWITYRNFQHVTSITEGEEFIYIATTGGILRYHLYGKYWDNPITRSQGLSRDEVFAIYYDFRTHTLWASTPAGVDYSINHGATWQNVDPSHLGLSPFEKIVKIGRTSENPSGGTSQGLWCLTETRAMILNSLTGYVIDPSAPLPTPDELAKGVNWGSGFIDDLRFSSASPGPETMITNFIAIRGWMKSGDLFRGPHLEEVKMSTVYRDRFGDVWVGTWGGPVFIGDFQMQTLTPISFGLAQDNAEMLVDAKTEMWIGGISQSPLTSDFRSSTNYDDFKSQERTDFSRSGFNSESASSAQGLTRLDKQSRDWEIFRAGKEMFWGTDQMYSGVPVDREWWFGSPEGIIVYTPGKNRWLALDMMKGIPVLDERYGGRHIVSLAVDDSYVYAGTPAGIARVSPVTRSSVSWILTEKLKNISVNALYWDETYLWIASRSNILKWNPKIEELVVYGSAVASSEITEEKGYDLVIPLPEELFFPITAICSSGDSVYFGQEQGIWIFDKRRQQWNQLTGQSHLVNSHILDLEISKSRKEGSVYLWIGTENGVYIYDVQNDYLYHFTIEDGLPSNRVKSIVLDDRTSSRSRDGEQLAWFGTPHGLVRFNWRKWN